MKKLIPSLFLTSLLINSINAETISLSYEVGPTYKVVLPTLIDISENQTSFTISVSGDIYYDSYLQISIDDSYITSNKTTYPIYINQTKDKFYCDELANGTSTNITINHDYLAAGTYTGSLNIQIVLKEEE